MENDRNHFMWNYYDGDYFINSTTTNISSFHFLMKPLKIRVNVEKSINHFKDSFCVANRKTQNEKTLHADLLLAGIAQLVTVIVADKIHQHQYIRSLKPLIA